MGNFVSYADPLTVDQAAISQMYDAMKSPWAVKGALMPDTHKGYALPIGAVVLADNFVVPAWVGYDIGCGMASVKTNIKISDEFLSKAEEIHAKICEKVPVGNNRHTENIEDGVNLPLSELGFDVKERRANKQFGTLGGGNHFIEVGAGNDGDIYITIHSGSRGFGHGIATEYMKLAANSDRPIEGHYGFSADSELGKQYYGDALYAQEWAVGNRREMIFKVGEAIQEVLGIKLKISEYINRNHNHVEEYTEEGVENLYVHRKGATHAEEGMMGVIPGNMRDGCFVVRGKGNSDWLNSSSHGAGRVLSRSQAKKQLDVDSFIDEMSGIASSASAKTIDESPLAYKDIFSVMELQTDSVEVVDYVRPLINVKG